MKVDSGYENTDIAKCLNWMICFHEVIDENPPLLVPCVYGFQTGDNPHFQKKSVNLKQVDRAEKKFDTKVIEHLEKFKDW